MTIVTDEQMGGDARIDGTRIAVYHIVQYRDAGYEPEEIADEFHLDREQVIKALEYADAHDVRADK